MRCKAFIAFSNNVTTQIRLLNSQTRALFCKLWGHAYTCIYIHVSDHHFPSKLIWRPAAATLENASTIYPVV